MHNAPLVYDEEMGTSFTEIVYYPKEEAEKLSEVKVDETVLRSFFRFDVTPWELCEQGLYPFSGDSGMFTMTEDDLKVFSENLPNVDEQTLDAWETQFACAEHMTHVYCPDNSEPGLSLGLAWQTIRDIFGWFDPEEDDADTITSVVDAYFASKGKPLNKIDVPKFLKSEIISGIERRAEVLEITEEQRAA